ncbi:tetratricopeptide repeat protein [Fundidesulfovibrio putealis]|uniref:tetratricopeptide repeat protein n=1 Tax=Fundidesulfovibrio putealis TaxID=270496 RepID=UPI00040E03C5|nr:tetratricopeptide repeat protein [Fundidesulfovibrio putealis]
MWPGTLLAFLTAVKPRPPAKTAWLLCLCILLAPLAPAWAQTYALSSDSSADLLTITFPKNAPVPVVLRTGAKRVEVLFPAGTNLKGVSGGTVRGRHISGLSVADNVLVVDTESDAFGFVSSPKGGKAVQLQVFYDPSGTRWKPAPGKPDASASASAQPEQAPIQTPAPQAPAAQSESLPGGGVKVRMDLSGTAPQQAPASGTAPAPAPVASQPSGAASASSPVQAPAGGPVSDTVTAPAPVTGQVAGQALPVAQPQAPEAKPQPAPAQGVTAKIDFSATPPSGAQGAGQPPAPATAPAPAQQGVTGSPVQPQASPPTGAQATGTIGPQPAKPSESAQPALASPAPVSQQIAQAPASAAAPAAGAQAVTQQPPASATPASPATPAPPAPAQPAPGEVRAPISFETVPDPAKPAAQGKIETPPEAPAAAPAQTPAAPGEQPPPPAPEAPLAPGQEKPDTLEDKAFLISGEQSLAHGDNEKALSIARTLLEKQGLSKELTEGALYLQAEAMFVLDKDKLAETYPELSGAIQQALNYNTTSMRVPRALIKLGYIHLRQGNLPEARAYFNLLRNKYPLDQEVPLIDVYWGEYYLDQAKQRDAKGNYERAAQAFREVLQKHPESRFARDAALGLSKALLELQQYGEAAKVVEYVDKRWPRYYVENPSLRRVAADIAYKLGDFARAKDDYLWFYNLVPKDSANDLVLARLGDVSVKLGKRDAAREFYDMAIRLYPGQEGALMAMMRMAEQGIHDAPTLQEMYKAFADPKDIKPEKIYEIIVNEYPKSALAPLALLKLTMWRMFKQEYPETLELANRFVKDYHGNDLEKSAVEVGAQAFGKMVGPLLEEMNYKRILELWRKYPFLAERGDVLSDRERLGVALALYYQGAPKDALAMAEPYLEKGPTPDAQKALALMLTIYRENQDWQSILETLRKVASWKMGDNPRRTLEFAQAMALEHTGEFARSRLLWARLAADSQLEPGKRAYAVYYQARTALERKDYDKALVWALDSRTLFKEAAKDDGKARDALQLMVEANQGAGRYREALALCAQLDAEAPPDSAEWAANRLRMAGLHRSLGDMASWRKVLEDMRDSQKDSLYGKLAASELATRGIEERAGRLSGPP